MKKYYSVFNSDKDNSIIYTGNNRKKAFELASKTKYDSYVEVFPIEWYEYEAGIGEYKPTDERIEYWRINGKEKENLL